MMMKLDLKIMNCDDDRNINFFIYLSKYIKN